MCDVLDKVENRGIAKGKIEGEMEAQGTGDNSYEEAF